MFYLYPDLSGDKELEGQLVESETECASLRESLGMLQDKLTASEGDRDNLSKMTQQLSQELEELRASMESSESNTFQLCSS